MPSYYYSGQGQLYLGTRNATTGRPEGLLEVGNVPSLEISIEVDKYEHKEATTGNRAVDLTLINEQNATFSMVIESFNSRNLALAFFGAEATVSAATVASESVTLYAPDTISGDVKKVPLAHINLDEGTPVTVADSLAASMTEGSDFEVNYATGMIWALPGWSGATLPDTVTVGYDHNGYPQVNAFTVTNVERYMRFDGINTVNGDAVVVDMFRAQFDPAQSWPLINDEVGQLNLTGNILQDSLNSALGSDFFIERKSINVA